MDTTETNTINHLSLCSGYEGIGLGLRRVLPNLREIAYVEREGFPIANLVAKMEAGELDPAPVFTDVKTFPYRKFRGCVDILSGGFPCQPFSNAGKREGVEDPRHLFPYIRDGIRECEPRIVFLENVEGIISSKTADGESVLQYVLRELEGLGYQATAGIFSASEVGAPHQRKRVFILGMANSEDIGRRGRADQNGDDRGWVSESSSKEQSVVRREAEGCSRDARSEEELAYSEGERALRETRTGGSETERPSRTLSREPQRSGCGLKELGYSQHDGCITSEESRETSKSQEKRRVQESQRGSDELADSDSKRLEGMRQCNASQRWQKSDGYAGGSCQIWPARPGEPQHEWEEPRVVVNTTSKGLEGSRGKSLQGTDQRLASTGQAESRLGRATNGTSSRVDRLRLLGNGVVPATAARAFAVLFNRIINN